MLAGFESFGCFVSVRVHIFELTVPKLANFARSGRHDERMVSNKMGGVPS